VHLAKEVTFRIDTRHQRILHVRVAREPGHGAAVNGQGTGIIGIETPRPRDKIRFKDGIAYDAKKLAADVQAMVEKQKRSRGAKTSTAAQP